MNVSATEKLPGQPGRAARPLSIVLLTLFGAGVVALAGAAIFVYSGAYNVSARWQDDPVIYWILHKVYQESLRTHSASVIVPNDYLTPTAIAAGAKLYDANCTACHGAPNRALSAIGRGINPAAPDVLGAQRRNNPKPVYWVLENGVRMSGMPAFGRTLSAEQIWQLTAFLHAKRGIDADEYTRLTASP